MIELRDAKKAYVTKTGVRVDALKGVSLKFPERGMIFILGKSGSGKSTLLNLMGGLDKFDSGEMLIKGKSTANFTQSDLDSYRNTAIGFIFQDYNILNEFNVVQNIALAMQLQNVKPDRRTIEDILKEVDLAGYEDRKPNELSGGQLQRIAIARALVKSPEIIMADEPTGALDSKTGIQVFETLKKLSAGKLILIVSHDREYAEMYGDRVIELSDGLVISDIEKFAGDSDVVSERVEAIDESVIRIKRGVEFSNADLKVLKDRLITAEFDTYISCDGQLNKKIERVANLSATGGKEHFKETDQTSIALGDQSGLKLIKSRLPISAAIRIGANALKYKKIRLAFTIIMLLISLSLFGVSDAIGTYNLAKMVTDSMLEENVNIVGFMHKGDDQATYYRANYLSDEMLTSLEREAGMRSTPIYSRGSVLGNNRISFSSDSSFNSNNYYVGTDPNIIACTQSQVEDDFKFNYIGKWPSTPYQVAITLYTYEHYELAGYKSIDGKASVVTSPAQFLSLNPYFTTDKEVKPIEITAIIDTKFPVDIKGRLDVISFRDDLSNDSDQIFNSVHNVIFMLPDAITYHLANKHVELTRSSVNNSGELIELTQQREYIEYTTDMEYRAFDGNNNRPLGENEIVISILSVLLLTDLGAKLNPAQTYYEYTSLYYNYYDALYSYLNNLAAYEMFEKDYEAKKDSYINEYGSLDGYSEWYEDKHGILDVPEYPLTEKEIDEIFKIAVEQLYNKPITIRIENLADYDIKLNVVGIFKPLGRDYINNKNLDASKDANVIYTHSNFINSLELPLYERALFDVSEDELLKLIAIHFGAQPFIISSKIVSTIEGLDSILTVLSKFLLYVGLGLIVLSSIMLMNFIATSIANKAKEIGILRAIGSRGKDVFAIFVSESIIIALITFVLSGILSFIAARVVADILTGNLVNMGNIVDFGIRQLVIMLGTSLLAAVAACALPVALVARKKPIDAIRKR